MTSFEETMLNLAKFSVSLPSQEIAETRRLSDIDILIAFADLKPQPIDDEICMICGDSHAIVQDYQEWIQCECCDRWVHQYCDGILNAELAQSLSYTCPRCRIQTLQQHPCNTNELLGRDPRYATQDIKNKTKKGTRRRREDESDDESKTTGGIGLASVQRRRNTVTDEAQESQLQIQSQQLSNLPQLTSSELQQSFKLASIEEKQFVEKKKSLAFDSTCHSLMNYVNGSFNQIRQPISSTFKNLQCVVRQDSPQQYKDVCDYAKEDVCFLNYMALFFMQQLDQQDPMTQEMRDNRRGNLELEREKRHQMQISQKMQALQLPTIIPRQNLDLFTPILQNDADLRAAVGLQVFDNLIVSVERNRLNYLRTMLVPAVQACYIYQHSQDGVEQADLPLDLILSVTRRILIRESIEEIDLGFNSYLPAEKLLQKDPNLLFNNDDIPELLSPRQWLDMSQRGLVNYIGVGLTRQTLLHAIVNIGLGLNIFDKTYGEQLTDHIIHYGVSSARRFVERQLHTSANACNIETNCLYQVPKPCEHDQCDCRISNGLVGCAEMISSDQRIQDWDILETPTSVVWALRIVGTILSELKPSSQQH